MAEEVNRIEPAFNLMARNTRGRCQNIPLLEQGILDIELVTSLLAGEAFEGIDRDPDRIHPEVLQYLKEIGITETRG